MSILKVGVRMHCADSSVQVVVIRAPGHDVALTCAGSPMAVLTGAPVPAGAGSGGDGCADVAVGKRYVLEDIRLEVLCTRSGRGPLAVDGRELTVRQAKPLPSSD